METEKLTEISMVTISLPEDYNFHLIYPDYNR